MKEVPHKLKIATRTEQSEKLTAKILQNSYIQPLKKPVGIGTATIKQFKNSGSYFSIFIWNSPYIICVDKISSQLPEKCEARKNYNRTRLPENK